MALLQINFFSHYIGSETNMNVILPEIDASHTKPGAWDGETPLPVLYLLHGITNDYSSWSRRTSIERYVAGKKLAVIMPDAANSFYSDELCGGRYWQFISKELPEVVKSYFRISDRREDTFAAGLSMGSFGAAKLALNFPDKYCKAALLSGGIFLLEEATVQAYILNIMGDMTKVRKSVNDLPYLAQQLSGTETQKPEFYLACGTEDFLYEQHKKMPPFLTKLGFKFTEHEEKGAAHNWIFWDKAIQSALDWMGIQ